MSERLRVLIVEDEEIDAELTCLSLQRGGFELDWKRVDSADGLREALDEREWDAIISDFAMPGFDGMRAFAIVAEQRLDIPFIFVSGALGEERAVEAMRTGANDYLLKGQLGRLAVAVRRELRAAHNRRSQAAAEESARGHQRRLALAVEASGAAIFESAVPADDRTFIAERCFEMLGHQVADLPRPESLVAWVLARIDPDDAARFEETFRSFIAGQSEALSCELRLRHRSGHWLDLDLRAKAVKRDEQGGVSHLVGVVLDLTERKRLEGRLRQSQKMDAIGRLAGGVAHDFNNVLTAIFSFGTFVMEELGEGHPAHSDMVEVLTAARRAAALTSQLLAFSRLKHTTPRVVAVADVLQGIERMLNRLLGADIDVMLRLGPTGLRVKIDPSELEQVLMNLTVNARDAMPGGGKLTIEVESVSLDAIASEIMSPDAQPGEYALIAVSDTGMGMDGTTLARVFEPFFTTKESGKGTGLGLSTCYGIAHQAGGFIWVYSEPGMGTTFKVYLPRSREAGSAADPRPSVEDLDGSGTVLVVEDDAQVRLLAVRTLERRGYRVLQASDGVDGLARSESEPGEIALLLTDVVMPRMSGRELADRLAVSRPNMRILFMSGYAPQAIFHRGELRPDQKVLQKPFTPDGLAREVRAVLAQSPALRVAAQPARRPGADPAL